MWFNMIINHSLILAILFFVAFKKVDSIWNDNKRELKNYLLFITIYYTALWILDRGLILTTILFEPEVNLIIQLGKYLELIRKLVLYPIYVIAHIYLIVSYYRIFRIGEDSNAL